MIPIGHTENDRQGPSRRERAASVVGKASARSARHRLVVEVDPQVTATTRNDAAHRTTEPRAVLDDERLVEVERVDPRLDQQRLLVRIAVLLTNSASGSPLKLTRVNIKKVAASRINSGCQQPANDVRSHPAPS